MRRSVSVLATVLALVLLSAGPALAAKPTHSPSEILDNLELPAGTACEFGVTLVTTSLRATTSVWELADGTVRIIDRGFADGYAESEEGRRFTQSGGYRIEIILNTDGSVVFNGSGNLFAWYFAGDPIVGLSDPGVYAIYGRLTEVYAPDESLAAARFYGGKVVDLCDALAPDAS